MICDLWSDDAWGRDADRYLVGGPHREEGICILTQCLGRAVSGHQLIDVIESWHPCLERRIVGLLSNTFRRLYRRATRLRQRVQVRDDKGQ